jgi:hypothetical protein
MKYPDGQCVRIGDVVSLPGSQGVVVCSIDDQSYSEDFPMETWGYLQKGALIEFAKYGLMHYVEPETDLVLVARRDG